MNRGLLYGALIGAAAGWAYLPLLWAMLAFAGIGAIVGRQVSEKQKRRREREQVRTEFRELLDSLASSYAAGSNTMTAFTKAKDDLQYAFGASHRFQADLERIVHGMSTNIPLERSLEHMAIHMADENVTNFVDSFTACLRRGGDLQELVRESRELLIEKQDLERDLEMLVAAGKRELDILAVLPFIVLLAMRFLQGDGSLLTVDIIVRLFCLPLFAGAYALGRKMMEGHR